MSLLAHLEPALQHLRKLKDLAPPKLFSLTTTQKVVVFSVATSIAVVGILARYTRRRKRVVDPRRYKRIFGKRSGRTSGLRSPNGDVVSTASSGKRSAHSERFLKRGSVISERASVASGSLASGGFAAPDVGDVTRLTPQQLGVMGMEALETSINYWEDALAVYRSSEGGGPLAVLGPEEASFCRDLQQLLEVAVELQERSEMLFLDERSVLFRPGSRDQVSTGGSGAEKAAGGTRSGGSRAGGSRSGGSKSGGGGSRRRTAGDGGSRCSRSSGGMDNDISGAESFASAQDQVADLRDFEEFGDLFPQVEQLPLYHAALQQLEEGGIPYRSLRTQLVKCGSDNEYLAKLHCVRLAFQHMLRDAINYHWFVDAGRQMLADLMIYADKDPKDFLIGYEAMLIYLSQESNWPEIELELSQKGVKALTFYDVVMDYILIDAFEDLESPPSSVTAVVQNRWLSNGFKETALTTAVWSVLKAKRRMLKFPRGFMAHFYTISEQLSPVFAWGFLGPDECLRETCMYFKEQVIGFLVDIFSFQRCKYTTVEDLARDLLENLKMRVGNVIGRLNSKI